MDAPISMEEQTVRIVLAYVFREIRKLTLLPSDQLTGPDNSCDRGAHYP